MNNRKKIFLLDKKIYIFCSIVFLVAQWLVSRNIFLMGDDYMYATFAKQGILSSVKEYYFTGNGRWFLNIIDSLILSADRYIYIIIMPWLLLLLAFLLYRVAVQICGRNPRTLYVIALVLVSMINISISRETIYWITGGLNYLVPALFFLGTVTLTLDLKLELLPKKWKKVFCGIICVLSSTTMEQFALMTIGWLIFLWGLDFIRYKKIEWYQILILCTSIIFLGTIIFAPGNGVRVRAAEHSQTFIVKVIDLFYNNYYSTAVVWFVIVLFFLEAVILLKKKKKLFILAILNAIYLLSVVLHICNGKIVLIGISAAFFIGFTFKVFSIINKKLEITWIVILGLLAIGSQMMLLISTIWGVRTSFSVLLIYILLVLVIYGSLEIKNNKNVIVTILYSMVACVIIVCCICPNIVGYKENKSIHNYNIEQALSHKDNIKIKSFKIEEYGWTTPPLSKFHEEYFRKYYEIPRETKIIYTEEIR